MPIINTATLTSNIQSDTGESVTITTKSNSLITNNINTDILVELSTNKNWAIPQDRIVITTKITNNSNINISDLNFKSTISEGASFVPESVSIGSEKHTELNPITGFIMPITIGASGNEAEVTFEIEINKHTAVNNINILSTTQISIDHKNFSITSNESNIKILQNEVYLLKSSSPTAVTSGETITYTIIVSNAGNLTNTNLIFTDPIPSGTQFVEGSVKIDNVSQATYNPANGFPLKDLNENDETTIQFEVVVD